MSKSPSPLVQFGKRKGGLTAVECTVLISLIILVCTVTLVALG